MITDNLHELRKKYLCNILYFHDIHDFDLNYYLNLSTDCLITKLYSYDSITDIYRYICTWIALDIWLKNSIDEKIILIKFWSSHLGKLLILALSQTSNVNEINNKYLYSHIEILLRFTSFDKLFGDFSNNNEQIITFGTLRLLEEIYNEV